MVGRPSKRHLSIRNGVPFPTGAAGKISIPFHLQNTYFSQDGNFGGEGILPEPAGFQPEAGESFGAKDTLFIRRFRIIR